MSYHIEDTFILVVAYYECSDFVDQLIGISSLYHFILHKWKKLYNKIGLRNMFECKYYCSYFNQHGYV